MLKPKTITTSTNGNGNGNALRLPKASDYKLPKKLDAKTKRFVAAGRAVMDALERERTNARKVEK